MLVSDISLKRVCVCGHTFDEHREALPFDVPFGGKGCLVYIKATMTTSGGPCACSLYQEVGRPLKTTVVHVRKHPFDVYIGRPSLFGNPFRIGKDGTRKQVIEKYREYIMKNPRLLAEVQKLKGKALACWCVSTPVDSIRNDKYCHGEVILEILGEDNESNT